MRRILILTADAGFGHRSVANSIASALQQKHPDDCTSEIVNPLDDRRTPALLRDSQSDYDRIVREAPRLYRLGYEASDAVVPIAIVESALTVMLYEVMNDILRRTRPDAIVITYPVFQAPLQAVFTIRRKAAPTLAAVTDLADVHGLWFNNRTDLCLVSNEKVRAQALEAGMAARRVHITGIPVRPGFDRRTRPIQELRTGLGWQADRVTFLAVGSRRVGNLPAVLHALNHSGLPIQLALVAGGDEDLYRQFQETHWHVPAHIYGFVDNMPTLMQAADGIISKAGGLIVSEALACGLPMLLVDVIPGQETGNARYVVDNGAGEVAKDGLAGLEVMCHWLEQGTALLAERSANARGLGKPHSALRAAELTWRAAHYGPSVRSVQAGRGMQRLRQLLDRFQVSWKEKTGPL
jgi:1,2-diacylglycerol 3-beta-galactosyltransferase